jgi:hypothetical protein
MKMLRFDFYPGETLVINNHTRIKVAWVDGDEIGLHIETSERVEACKEEPRACGTNIVKFPRLK